MKTNNKDLPLDQFIEFALYDKVNGYYMKKNPFGKEGDFITAPNITRVFSEIIAIWTVTFWKSLGSPKKFNLLEFGAGNGEMMKVIIETLKNFPECFLNCNFQIHEKSELLKKKQQLNLKSEKIIWIEDINTNNSYPTIFLANEFFDALPIKQFFKKTEGWVERFVNFKEEGKAEFREQPADIKKIEQNLNFAISKEQEIIEYSPSSFEYLKNICNLIKKNDGGMFSDDSSDEGGMFGGDTASQTSKKTSRSKGEISKTGLIIDPTKLKPGASMRGKHKKKEIVIARLLESVSMKMMSVIAVTPKEGAADEITELIVESRKDGVDGLDSYTLYIHMKINCLLLMSGLLWMIL